MSLLDFATIEQARTHSIVVGRMVSPDMVISMLTEHDSALTLEDLAKTNPKAAGFWLALNGGAVTEYNVITGVAGSTGMKHQALLTYLVSVIAITQAFKDAVIAYGNPITYPYANATQEDFDEAHDAGEVVALMSHIGQHNIRVYTSVKPRKATTLDIEHRFGTGATNLTSWHKVGSVLNVFYPTTLTGAPYISGQIPATSAAYRELRLVSPLTLGVTVEGLENAK